MDKKQKDKRKRTVIYPDNDKKEIWDLFMAIVLLLTCVKTPYDIAFNADEGFTTKVMNGVTDILFFFDMCVIFNTVIYDTNMRFVTDRKRIAKDYLKGWFTVDLLSIVPFDLMIQSQAKNMTSLVRVTRVGKLYKLVKLTRLIRLLKVLK